MTFTKDSSNSIDRFRSKLGSEAAIEFSNIPSEKHIVPPKREIYQHKNAKGHIVHSLVLDNI
jgi:hypothetical protein